MKGNKEPGLISRRQGFFPLWFHFCVLFFPLTPSSFEALIQYHVALITKQLQRCDEWRGPPALINMAGRQISGACRPLLRRHIRKQEESSGDKLFFFLFASHVCHADRREPRVRPVDAHATDFVHWISSV